MRVATYSRSVSGQASSSGSSILAAAAAGMSAGTWLEVTGTGLTDAILDNPPSGGVVGHMLEYAARANWDTVNKKLFITGASHVAWNPGGSCTPSASSGTNVQMTYSAPHNVQTFQIGYAWMNGYNISGQVIAIDDTTHLRVDVNGSITTGTSTIANGDHHIAPIAQMVVYDDLANTWTVKRPGDFFAGRPRFVTWSHDYCEFTLAPEIGKAYKYSPGDNYVYELDLATMVWNATPLTRTWSYSSSLADESLTWFPDRNGMLLHRGDAGAYWYQRTAGVWGSPTLLGTTAGGGAAYPTGAYGNIATHNSVTQEIMWGGGVGYGHENNMFIMNNAGTITACATTPGQMVISNNPTTTLTHCPVSGDYLVMTTTAGGVGTFRKYVSATDTWTTLTGARIPPFFGIGDSEGDVYKAVVAALPAYGVIVCVRRYLSVPPKVLLYKHS